jgi:ATP-dependent protease Clp ATPase subunit
MGKVIDKGKRMHCYCRFCDKSNVEAKIMIARHAECPGMAVICDECVDLCAEILAEQRGST